MLFRLSNEGAKQRFEHYLDDFIYPILVNCAESGCRECHLVVLSEQDVIEWDAQYPPPKNENEELTQTIQNEQIYRFFMHIENRNIAKYVLKERGLKKIRFGIEGKIFELIF